MAEKKYTTEALEDAEQLAKILQGAQRKKASGHDDGKCVYCRSGGPGAAYRAE